jgi:ring-1,2-phenylacetyl-CoA epoxidase subunit PaaD
MVTRERAWQALESVPDPEIPVLSVCDLGIVRELRVEDDAATVVITPTYSGCPATEMIEAGIRQALESAGAAQVSIEQRLAPPWSTDWIAPAALEKLRAFGIAPPGSAHSGVQPVRFVQTHPPCPRCGSRQTMRLAEFGSTACKALYRCSECAEPFDYFKPI